MVQAFRCQSCDGEATTTDGATDWALWLLDEFRLLIANANAGVIIVASVGT